MRSDSSGPRQVARGYRLRAALAAIGFEGRGRQAQLVPASNDVRCLFGDASGRGRTDTLLRELDFESSASAYSATEACVYWQGEILAPGSERRNHGVRFDACEAGIG